VRPVKAEILYKLTAGIASQEEESQKGIDSYWEMKKEISADNVSAGQRQSQKSKIAVSESFVCRGAEG